MAEQLDEANIYVWDGNYYALAVTERLGLEDSGGMVRVGPVHYNTVEEIKTVWGGVGEDCEFNALKSASAPLHFLHC